MYAIVEIAGQQFKVEKDQKVFVHRLKEEEGSQISFDKVYLIDNEGEVVIGAPAITGTSVEAKVVRHLKGDKVIIFKKKRRKGYRVKNGHRQSLTEILVTNISEKGGVAKSEKKQEPVVMVKGNESGDDLNFKTVAELKKIATEKGIEGISKMKKADLVEAINNN